MLESRGGIGGLVTRGGRNQEMGRRTALAMGLWKGNESKNEKEILILTTLLDSREQNNRLEEREDVNGKLDQHSRDYCSRIGDARRPMVVRGHYTFSMSNLDSVLVLDHGIQASTS